MSAIKSTLWLDHDEQCIYIIDQTLLPYTENILQLQSLDEICKAIISMQVRGAPLIGITAAFGFAFALRDSTLSSEEISKRLLSTRPTAVNLHWAIKKIIDSISAVGAHEAAEVALNTAKTIWTDDKAMCSQIGEHGLEIIKQISPKDGSTVNILTHCNAGWLATGEWGTALAPIYKAHQSGINIHVWVDETRPRNQGYLTSWELTQAGVPHTLIVDNAGGHLMQHQQIDCCIVGSDRTTAQGDVCNKIGTYLKALAAHDNKIPFYVALPTSTIDWTLQDGLSEIPIEERPDLEVRVIHGMDHQGEQASIYAVPSHTRTANPAFDVTPARYISGLITEKGVFKTSPEGMKKLQKICGGL